MDSTLLLNADGNPVSLLPLSTVSWQESVNYIWMETATSLHYYDDWIVHSPSVALKIPSVLILNEHVKIKRRICEDVGSQCLSSRIVFLRDSYTCQYCGEKFSHNELTQDHVIPRRYGGKSTYENITTSCAACNGKRGHDARIQPMTRPFRPSYHYLVKMAKKFPITIPHESWANYLDWDRSLIILNGVIR